MKSGLLPDKIGGLVYKFADEETKKVKYNSDGTVPVDVIKTGTYSHFWYGTFTYTKEHLEDAVKNFEDNIVGYTVTWNYFHDRNKNFGKPVRLRVEERPNAHYLVADTALTPQGKEDLENGEVLNFSAEITSEYVHREVDRIPVVNADGLQEKDEDGEPLWTYIRRKYGTTIVGGAVTNYPFIPDLNKGGIGGNESAFETNKFSISNGLLDLRSDLSGAEHSNIMMFSSLDEYKPKNELKQVNFKSFNEALSHSDSVAIMCPTDEYKTFSRQYSYFEDGVDCLFGVGDNSHDLVAVVFDSSKFTDEKSKDWLKKKNLGFSEFRCAIFTISNDEYTNFKNPVISNGKLVEMPDTIKTDKEGEEMPNEQPKTLSIEDVQSMIASEAQKIRESVEKEFSDRLEANKVEHEAMLAAERDKLAKLSEENKNLSAFMAKADEQNWRLSIDKALSGAEFENVPVSFSSVAKNALVGNKGVTIKYYDSEKKEYSDISLVEFCSKLADTVEDTGSRLGDDKNTKPKTDDGDDSPKNFNIEDLTQEDMKEIAENEEKFTKLLSEVGVNYKFRK